MDDDRFFLIQPGKKLFFQKTKTPLEIVRQRFKITHDKKARTVFLLMYPQRLLMIYDFIHINYLFCSLKEEYPSSGGCSFSTFFPPSVVPTFTTRSRLITARPNSFGSLFTAPVISSGIL